MMYVSHSLSPCRTFTASWLESKQETRFCMVDHAVYAYFKICNRQKTLYQQNIVLLSSDVSLFFIFNAVRPTQTNLYRKYSPSNYIREDSGFDAIPQVGVAPSFQSSTHIHITIHIPS